MAHRVFLDAGGVEWQVWSVIPTLAQRLLESTPDLRPTLRSGWLAFQAGKARRRLVPIPPDWESMTVGELRGLLQRAVPLGDRRRLSE
jgi:hypothetical protein